MTNSIDWEDIIENLDHQNCILFLGPQAYTDHTKVSLETRLLEELKVYDGGNPYIKAYYEDGFFLFREKRFKRKVIRQINQFYQDQLSVVEGFVEKLARIPFHLYISMTPDRLLLRGFENLQIPCFHSFYNKGKAPAPFLKPNNKVPLVYNMLGMINRNESVVLTHNDLFDYLKSIFVGKSMPIQLRESLFEAEQYIFLGLPFEKWYLQLLFRILSLHTSELEHLERIATRPESDFKKDLFHEQFRIEFIPDDVTNFVDRLYLECEAAGKLRIPSGKRIQTKRLTVEEVEKAVVAGEERKAMGLMMSILELYLPRTEQLRSDLILLMNRFENIENQFLQGIEDPFSRSERNKVVSSFLQLVEKFRSLI